jgi:hypothetical protein
LIRLTNKTTVVLITPVLVTNIGWGTFLFFAVLNATFIPVIYFWYPETARRSLEEIDIIFAKGNVEKISYVRAARELPLLTAEEVEQEALRYGLIETAARGAIKAAAGGGGRKTMGEEGENEKGEDGAVVGDLSGKKSDEDSESKDAKEEQV